MKTVVFTIKDPPNLPSFDAQVDVDDIASFVDYQVTPKSGRVLNVVHTRGEIERILGPDE
jgi:hypothetical protein